MGPVKSSKPEFYYSDKYYDEEFEYRHVHVPKELVKTIPKDRLMTEEEWRRMGVTQSLGWVHYMLHKPERHILLFRRPRTDLQGTSKSVPQFKSKAAAQRAA